MLWQLTIENIALIERLDLDFKAGLTILTGETGAGKSILLDALTLVLGARAEVSLIRSGTERAMVSARFLLSVNHPARAWLTERDLDTTDEEIFLRRVLTPRGRSRAFINEIAVPLALLAEIGSLLVEIHGQHENQALLQGSTHRILLDAFAGHGEHLQDVATAHNQWRHIHEEMRTVEQQSKERGERRDYIAFQLEELAAAGIMPGELEELTNRRGRLAHASGLAQAVENALKLLTGSTQAASVQAHKAASELEGSTRLDPGLATLAEAVRSLQYELDDMGHRLQHYLDGLEIDPIQLEEISERVNLIHRLSRKHHTTADELADLVVRLRAEIDTLEHAEERLGQLGKKLALAREDYFNKAQTLTESRKKASGQLTMAVEEQLRELHMTNTRLSIIFHPLSGDPRPLGMEDMVFHVSTNPGEAPKPLKQVASGGELSRIMLALKTVLSEGMPAETLIFDEVDVGISGRVAAGIGAKMAQVADNRQVLAVTHLPQVAAWGRQHFRVAKETHAGRTLVFITALDKEARIEELARMLAGEHITATARKHAEDLLRIEVKNNQDS